MSVWAFACKLESSMNRWFDGSDQDVYPVDKLSFEYKKGSVDSFDAEDVQRKAFIKYVSEVRSGIGSMVFNATMFNQFFRQLSDFSDAVFMQDVVELRLSREIVRLADTIHPVEYFNKEYSSGNVEVIVASDDTFIGVTNVDTVDGSAIDDAMVTDVANVEMTRVIAPTVDDSISFTDVVKVGIGGKSIYDLVSMNDTSSVDIDISAGDEIHDGAIGSFIFNELLFNGQSQAATVGTVIGLTEDVQIILTN